MKIIFLILNPFSKMKKVIANKYKINKIIYIPNLTKKKFLKLKKIVMPRNKEK